MDAHVRPVPLDFTKLPSGIKMPDYFMHTARVHAIFGDFSASKESKLRVLIQLVIDIPLQHWHCFNPLLPEFKGSGGVHRYSWGEEVIPGRWSVDASYH